MQVSTGKADQWTAGNSALPLFVAQILPDGSSWFARYDHNVRGFFGSEEAGTRNAVVMTPVQNCRMHGIDPYEYFKDMLERLPRMTNQDDLDQLMPLNWKKARNKSLQPTNAVARYVYDRDLVLQERDRWNAPQVTYTRGVDLSGRKQGAGGIGGLLARHDHPSRTAAYYHADGSGNVSALIDAQNRVMARYLYDPFGNLLSQAGPLAEANRQRFSSKEYHPGSGLYRFGRRSYWHCSGQLRVPPFQGWEIFWDKSPGRSQRVEVVAQAGR